MTSPPTIAERLLALLQPPEERISLAEAALCIAQIEYQAFDPRPYIQRLDAMSEIIARRMPPQPASDAMATVSEINHCLFEEEGFRGNSEDYYDPHNNFLNEVLDRKRGIPIMLSTVYLEVASRLQFPLVGVGLPGHFLVKYPGLELLIDPFSQGRIVSPSDCEQRMKQVLGDDIPFHDSYLNAVSKRHTVTRMLNNLRNAYVSLRLFAKALEVTDLVLALHPQSMADLLKRATFLIELKRYAETRETLARCQQATAETDAAEQLRQAMLSLRRILASLN